MSTPSPDAPARAARTFRLPRSAYLAVLVLLVCTVPLAMAGGTTHGGLDSDTSFSFVSDTPFGPRLLLLLIPVAAWAFIARTRTRVDAEGIRVRALFGERRLGWDGVRGLSVAERSVYAVCSDGGSVRLPCVRVADLHALAAASGGRLPDVPPAPVKPAPAARANRVRRG